MKRMRTMVRRMGESRLWTMANGVMDGIHIGAIAAAIVYGAILAMKFMLFDDLVTAWISDYSWDNAMSLVMFLVTAIAYWVFCEDSRMWRNNIYDKLEFEENIYNVVYWSRSNCGQLAKEARQKQERKLRPERHSEAERKTYKMACYSVVLLLIVLTLALSVSGLLVLKLMLAVAAIALAVFTDKCTDRLVHGFWY